jgi:hypothetical protein
MARPVSWDALLAAFDGETTRIANKIQRLLDQIIAGGMTELEEAEVQASLQAQVDRLKLVGADPVEPIPPVEPEAPPA